MHERYIDTWLLNVNLQTSLDLWKAMPDSSERLKKVEWSIQTAMRQGNLKLIVSKDVIGKRHDDTIVLTQTDARNYGLEEGQGITFETSREMKFRVGFIKSEAFFMIDRKDAPTFAFFRPEDIMSIVAK